MNIQKILVPVDFSTPSRLALGCAVAAARQFHASLVLLNVVETPIPLALSFPSHRVDTAHHIEEQARRMLCALLGPEDQDHLNVQTCIRDGDVQQEILATVKEESPDLIVMGTHGRGKLGQWLIGSVTQDLLRHLPVPILTVAHSYEPMSFARILAATDFSSAADHAVEWATSLAAATHGTLIVMHSNQLHPMAYGGPADVEAEVKLRRVEARRRLSAIASRAERQKVHVETLFPEGPAGDNILQAANDTIAELIVIGVNRKPWLEKLILGTTAERLIRDATVPVLCVPPKEDIDHRRVENQKRSEPHGPVYLVG